ncbi:MAG: hypothetical protein ABI758_03640 [Candidatus Woesebacteria bacterium]
MALNNLDQAFGKEVESANEDRASILLQKAIDHVMPVVLEKVKEMTDRNPENEDLRHDLCHMVNGILVTELINTFHVPAMEYRIDVNKDDSPLKNKSWNFHAMAITHLEGSIEDPQALFGLIDQTSIDPRTKRHYLKLGTLKELQSDAEATFGGFWDFDELPIRPDERQNTVRQRIENAQHLIQNGDSVDFNQHLYTQGRFDKNTQKPLGLKVVFMMNRRSPSLRYGTV